MVSTFVFCLATALASAFVARAIVSPTEPSPGSVYREGETCPITWNADPDSPSDWKNMNIQLMTGDNFNMQHLTTVATNQDGSANGHFEYPCPGVTINAPIYFYQFTSPSTTNRTWTGRFAIASTTGQTVSPPNATQPGSGEAIPWGTGSLSDPSKAVPPPASAGGSVVSASGALLATTSLSSTPSSALPVTLSSTLLSSSALTTGSPSVIVTPSPSAFIVTTTVPAASTADSAPASPSQSNSASGMSATSMTSLILPALAFMLI
ncbi:hypothetical protein P691DRAFT_770636 [Macrolepiota fuliginosa MF-IS2]|uniref:Yeast cell wall synthesis Kre9/Knh1-like N-terminal domain-containing protein n=1 Tax=Macrolepiota fuliginosa MF-IS2 TaxID=1400762 RepID=A0A9P6C6W5_9AGAR|nr:hypothetical protein P691DRAFT_770636 [Macrolepiota fuliginosa MF-IS2]